MSILRWTAAAAALSAVLLTVHFSAPVPQVKPQNVGKCDDKAQYTLVMNSFDSDDLVPGKPCQMKAVFTPTASGHIETMEMKVYKMGIKIWSQTYKQPMDFQKDTQFVFDFKTTLPSFIPHITVHMNLDFMDGPKQEQGCIAFDLSF